uniref:Uncharacterized protein n=1 Tax=Physcomitrium patens TaxID=3218 RepID=A0A2K1L8R0_PHYPA|nr:hypothetical protein PHYPA_000826 [Physcomitrium patens]
MVPRKSIAVSQGFVCGGPTHLQAPEVTVLSTTWSQAPEHAACCFEILTVVLESAKHDLWNFIAYSHPRIQTVNG